MPGRRWWQAMLVAVLVAALPACARSTPEQQLRDTVASLQAAVEAREAGALRPLLADDFVGPDGLDRDGAVGLARITFLRHRQVGASIVGPLRVQMQTGHAQVAFDAALTGGSGQLLPDAMRVYSVQTGWRLVDGDWQLTSATWTPRL